MRGQLLKWIGAAGLLLAPAACVIRDSSQPVNSGYYAGSSLHAGVSVAQPTPYTVSAMPPDPLYEQMSPSPGVGHVWIDGSWHWNGWEWVWVGGRWGASRSATSTSSRTTTTRALVRLHARLLVGSRSPPAWHDHPRSSRWSASVVAPPQGGGGYRPPRITRLR
jgi:hypothetical protein